jgi:hypothetical protein
VRVLLVLMVAAACGDDMRPEDADRIDALEALVEDYESGAISRDTFRSRIG